jgi:hypothetical protein
MAKVKSTCSHCQAKQTDVRLCADCGRPCCPDCRIDVDDFDPPHSRCKSHVPKTGAKIPPSPRLVTPWM